MILDFWYEADKNSKFAKDAFDEQIGKDIRIRHFGKGIILGVKVSDDGDSALITVEMKV